MGRFALNAWQSGSSAWCYWRCSEIRNGVIRADSALLPAATARRQTAIPGPGVLRPMGDIGNSAPSGVQAVNIARLWIENAPHWNRVSEPWFASCPWDPSQWQHVRVGQPFWKSVPQSQPRQATDHPGATRRHIGRFVPKQCERLPDLGPNRR